MRTSDPVSPELIDLITEAVARPGSAVDRAAVIVEIVDRVLDAVRWRHGSHPERIEADSLVRLLEAARAHETRMMEGG